jgi:hypothetical protein
VGVLFGVDDHDGQDFSQRVGNACSAVGSPKENLMMSGRVFAPILSRYELAGETVFAESAPAGLRIVTQHGTYG